MVKRGRWIVLLVFLFILSRVWAHSIGVRFDDYRRPPENKVHIMQMYPPEAMEENLWETIWYNHSQPPLYSLLVHLTGMDGALVHTMWMMMGLIAMLAFYSVTRSLFVSGFVPFLVSLIWIISPSTMLFENTIIYTYPVACLLIIAAWCLQRGHLVSYSVVCCVITLTRSLFHPLLWLLPILGIGWWSMRK